MTLLVRVLLNGLGLWAAAQLLPGVHYAGDLWYLLLAGVVIGILNLIVKPLVTLLSLPIVLINGYVPDIPAPFVSCDDREAGELAVAHLVALGHRRIGLITGPDRFVPVRRKMVGYKAEMKRLVGVSDQELSELTELSLFGVEGGEAAAARLLDLRASDRETSDSWRASAAAAVAASSPCSASWLRSRATVPAAPATRSRTTATPTTARRRRFSRSRRRASSARRRTCSSATPREAPMKSRSMSSSGSWPRPSQSSTAARRMPR